MSDDSVPSAHKPHWVWWIAHFALGIISGLVVYVLYHNENPAAAKRHLILSILIWAATSVVFFLALMLLEPMDAYLDLYASLSSTL